MFPEPVACPSMGVGKPVTASEPRRRLSAQSTIHCKLGELGDRSLPEHPAKDWNVWATYHPLGGAKWLCLLQQNTSQGGGGPGKDSRAKISHGPGRSIAQYAHKPATT